MPMLASRAQQAQRRTSEKLDVKHKTLLSIGTIQALFLTIMSHHKSLFCRVASARGDNNISCYQTFPNNNLAALKVQ